MYFSIFFRFWKLSSLFYLKMVRVFAKLSCWDVIWDVNLLRIINSTESVIPYLYLLLFKMYKGLLHSDLKGSLISKLFSLIENSFKMVSIVKRKFWWIFEKSCLILRENLLKSDDGSTRMRVLVMMNVNCSCLANNTSLGLSILESINTYS
jgi:hypothetical protein